MAATIYAFGFENWKISAIDREIATTGLGIRILKSLNGQSHQQKESFHADHQNRFKGK
jgi:hypothetical protein